MDYYEKFIKDYDVDIRFNQEANPETVKAMNPDIVLLGVGAKPITLNIPGETGPNVYSVEQVLKVKLI